MPQCPHCKTHYELGKQYCDTCESYLLHPEEGDTFCPQCGIRVSPRQEICHKCDAPLPASQAIRALSAGPEAPVSPPGALEPPSGTPPTPSPSEGPRFPTHLPSPVSLPSWVLASLVGGGLIILALVIIVVILMSRTPSPPPSTPTPMAEIKVPATTPSPAPVTPAPPAELSLSDQLTKVLENLKEAQLQQDIIRYMSCYSYLYPTLDERRQNTVKSWENYRFMELSFFLDEVRPRGPDNALAQVTWKIQVQNRRTDEVQNLTQTFRVAFARELGHWRIRSLEELEEGEK